MRRSSSPLPSPRCPPRPPRDPRSHPCSPLPRAGSTAARRPRRLRIKSSSSTSSRSGCSNCRNVVPNLRAIVERRSHDVAIVGIHSPETPYGKTVRNRQLVRLVERLRGERLADATHLRSPRPLAQDDRRRFARRRSQRCDLRTRQRAVGRSEKRPRARGDGSGALEVAVMNDVLAVNTLTRRSANEFSSA